MDHVRSFKSFINSHYLSEGIRMTAVILFPAFLMSYFDLLNTGIILSMGAALVSMTDSIGPIHHRTNAMMACNVAIFIVVLITGAITQFAWLLGIFLFIACFLFSMLGVYGARAGSIGLAALITIVLNISHQRQGWEILQQALYVTSGGLWYMCFSLLIYNFRPHKIVQQALGEYIQTIAEYLRIRAELYSKDVDYNATYRRLLQHQSTVQEKQNTLSELIFKTRSIVKETTHTGRVVVMIFMDAMDMFERTMNSYQRCSTLHEYFDDTHILEQYQSLALQITSELEDISIAVQSGHSSDKNSSLITHIKEVKQQLDELSAAYMKPDNIDGFISLRRIMENIQDLAERLQTLHQYTTYDRSLKKRPVHKVDPETFISHQEINPRLLIDNLTLGSDIFRHSLRISIAVIAGYIVSLFFEIGHSYWILLTVIVILKPAYSLTKKRNKDRLLGTVLGALTGVLTLNIVQNNTALLVLMILFMTAYLTFSRKNYFIMVITMTAYILIFFHLIYPGDFTALIKDRVIDTTIGSVIAFAANIFLMPSWEKGKIRPLMVKMLENAIQYFILVSDAFSKGEPVPQHTLHFARKNALVALANLSDAFNRMLSEPKSQQKGIKQIHKFVVLNHMLTSYIAGLSAYLKAGAVPYTSAEFNKVVEDVKQYFLSSVQVLDGTAETGKTVSHAASIHMLNEKANTLLQKGQEELQEGRLQTATNKALFNVKSVVDQFNLVYKAAADIYKVSCTLVRH